MQYNTIEEFVRANGYEVSDLTKEELRDAKKEMEAANRGEMILDSVFDGYTIEARKKMKEGGK